MNKLKIIKKSYKIDFNRIEGNFYSEITCHADSRNEARKKLLSLTTFEDFCLKYTTKVITYLTIPVIRDRATDIVLFEGEEILRCNINHVIAQREKKRILDNILTDANIKYCYIRKHGCYYRSNFRGYTERREHAGIYSKEDAVDATRGVDDCSIVPININEHNEYITAEIEKLKSHLI